MRVLVTGAAGFIGSHYVRSMLSGDYPGFEDAEVTVFDKLTYAGNLENLAPVSDSPRYRFVQGDICDPAQVADAVAGHDIVVNFAAESHVDRSIYGAAEFVVTNVLGAQTLFDACVRAGIGAGRARLDRRGVRHDPRRLVDRRAHPRAELPLFGKQSRRRSARTRIRRHLRAEHLGDPLHEQLRALPVPGEGHPAVRHEPDRRPDGAALRNGDNIRDWLHVDDHCRGIQLVVEKGAAGEFYNIGGGIELSNKELTQRLLDACGATWDSVVYVEDRKNHDLRYSLDDAKLRAMGYEPQTSFDEGLAKTVQWYRDNQAWWRALKAKAALAK